MNFFGFFKSASCFRASSVLFDLSVIHFFLLLSNISLCEYTARYVHLPDDWHWYVFRFWWLWIKAPLEKKKNFTIPLLIQNNHFELVILFSPILWAMFSFLNDWWNWVIGLFESIIDALGSRFAQFYGIVKSHEVRKIIPPSLVITGTFGNEGTSKEDRKSSGQAQVWIKTCLTRIVWWMCSSVEPSTVDVYATWFYL